MDLPRKVLQRKSPDFSTWGPTKVKSFLFPSKIPINQPMPGEAQKEPEKPQEPWEDARYRRAIYWQGGIGVVLICLFLFFWTTKEIKEDGKSVSVPLSLAESRPATLLLEAIKVSIFGLVTTVLAQFYKWRESMVAYDKAGIREGSKGRQMPWQPWNRRVYTRTSHPPAQKTRRRTTTRRRRSE